MNVKNTYHIRIPQSSGGPVRFELLCLIDQQGTKSREGIKPSYKEGRAILGYVLPSLLDMFMPYLG